MPQGLQIWDALGNSVIDTTTRLGRYLGATSTGTINNSITDIRFSTGVPFWFINSKGTIAEYNIAPSVTFTNNILSWDWGTLPLKYRIDSILIYGVY